MRYHTITAVSVLEAESSASVSQHQSTSYQQPQSLSSSTSSTSTHTQHTPGPKLQPQPDQQLSWQQPQPHPQQQQQVTKLNTSAARSADSLAASGRGQSSAAAELRQDDTVDSWEDIADSAETPQVGVVDRQVSAKKPQQDVKTSRVINQSDSKPSAVAANVKDSGNQSSLTTGTTPSVSNGNGKKHPSPNLSEKKPGRSESKQAALAALQQPPPKTEDDKENLNIVFIGHVGE